MFAVEAISHAWLFPRCAAVVHHSAAGTTAAGLRAGVPTIPVPHNSDQFSWGNRLPELGVGTAPIARRKLTLEALEQAIRTATTDPAMRRRRGDVGERIRAEDGVGRAVEAFGRRIGAPRRSTPPSSFARPPPTRAGGHDEEDEDVPRRIPPAAASDAGDRPAAAWLMATAPAGAQAVSTATPARPAARRPR